MGDATVDVARRSPGQPVPAFHTADGGPAEPRRSPGRTSELRERGRGRPLDHVPLAQLTLARIRELSRQKEAIFWTFFFPVVMAVGLGIAFRNDGGETVRVAIERGPGAEAVAAALRGHDGIQAEVLASEEAGEALRKGAVALVVVPDGDGFTYRYDRDRREGRLARLAVDDALQRSAGRTDARVTRDEIVTEKGSRYVDFLIPGLIGLNLVSTGLWGMGYALVRMRIGKLLKRLAATPMRRSEFLLSFVLARLVFLAAELALVLVAARLAFGVTVRGSLASFVAIAVLGAVAFSGLGLLVASRARTLETVSGLINLVSVPMWILSGVFFPTDHFPELMQPLIHALPLTALLDALRAVMIDGASLVATAGSLAIVAAWGAACFAVALAIFRWR